MLWALCHTCPVVAGCFWWLIQFPLWTYRELGNLEESTFVWVAKIEVQEDHQAGAFVNEQACEVCSPLSATENAQVGLDRVCVCGVLLNFRHLGASEKINIRSSGIKWSPEDYLVHPGSLKGT